MASASTEKHKVLHVATKFEIIQACENSDVSNSEIGRHNLNSSTLFTFPKNKSQN
jgi:hypothetical protein